MLGESVLEEALRALAYAALVGLAFAPLERVFALEAGRRTRWATDLLFATVGHAGTRLLLLYGLGTALLLAQELATDAGLGAGSPLAALHPALRLPLGLLLFELAGYGYHRLAHSVPLLWRLHRVHHTAPTMDWLASFRRHPLEIALMTLAQNLPLVLLGVPLAEHAMVVLLLALNTVFVHGNLRTPRWLERVIATPRFHHRHHDAHARPANYATLFPWLDRLFGTHDAADAGVIGLPDGDDPGFVALLLARAPRSEPEAAPEPAPAPPV